MAHIIEGVASYTTKGSRNIKLSDNMSPVNPSLLWRKIKSFWLVAYNCQKHQNNNNNNNNNNKKKGFE